LGTVQIELEFDDRGTLPFTVSPIHAAIIILFQENNKTWRLEDLATKLGMPRDPLKKRITFWVNNQILCEIQKDVYQLVEKATEDTTIRAPAEEEEDNNKDESAATAAQEEVMRISENFIIGMLTNFEKMPLEKIHVMLSNFVENYSASPLALKQFLQKLIKEDKVECVAGEYSKKQ